MKPTRRPPLKYAHLSQRRQIARHPERSKRHARKRTDARRISPIETNSVSQFSDHKRRNKVRDTRPALICSNGTGVLRMLHFYCHRAAVDIIVVAPLQGHGDGDEQWCRAQHPNSSASMLRTMQLVKAAAVRKTGAGSLHPPRPEETATSHWC